MSWQDKALAAFWADAFANEPLDSHRRIEAAIAAAAASLLPSTDAPMDDNAITPPPELVKKWMSFNNIDIAPLHLAQALATQAARWGSDQELEACANWLADPCAADMPSLAKDLRYSRRPKPPSLAEEALKGPSDEELAECYRKAYYAHKDRQGPAAQVAALRAVLAKWGRQ